MPITAVPYTAVYFNPQSVSGCCVWLDAADPVSFNSGGITNGTTITQWNDKSGVGQSITVAGTPVWNSTTLNSSPSVNLTNGRFSGVFTNTLSNFTYTAFIITSLNSYPTGGYPCLAFQNTPSGTFLRVLDYAGAFRYYSFLTGGFGLSTTASLTTPFLWSTTYNGSTSGYLYYNGSNTANSTAASSPGCNAAYFYLGTEPGDIPGVNSWPGYVSEVIVYTSVLSTTQRQQVEGYLAQKWGLTSQLPAGHPGLTQTIYTSNYNYKFYQSRIPLSLQATYYQNFNPITIPNCLIWFDAADSTKLSLTGTTVNSWTSKGSYTGSAAANTGTVVSGTVTQNGLNVVRFAGGTQLAFTMAVPNQARAWFTVTRCITQLSQAASPSFWAIIGATTSGGGEEAVGGIAYGVPGTNSYNASLLQPGITDMVRTTATVPDAYQIWTINSYVDSAVSTGSNFLTINGTPQTLANNSLASGYKTSSYTKIINQANLNSGMDLGEILMYNGEITTPQRQLVESYLAQKWGLQGSLPSNHPNNTAPAGLPSWESSVTLGLTHISAINATGGTITIANGYKIHTFTTVGTTNFVVGQPFQLGTSVQLLIVAGGGSGSGDRAAGGGGGGLIFTNMLMSPGTYSVVVGAGGTVGTGNVHGTDGSNSSFNGQIAIGGGSGGSHVVGNGVGNTGGSGGGGAAPGPGTPTAVGGSGTSGQGYGGGTGYYNGSICSAGGGGGAGGAGSNATTTKGGNGGPGLFITIGGNSAYYAGGGGGAAAQDYGAAVGGIGGVGGGGTADQSSTTAATAGTPNTGGGGAGAGNAGWPGNATNGGSGIVIIAYPYP